MSAVLDGIGLSPVVAIALGAALLGGLAGWLIERSHFCTMGAISDWYLFGSQRRLRAWGLAIATALVLTQLAAAVGLVPLALSEPLGSAIEPVALIVGGVLFGIGMVLAGGCASRNLVRLGGGSLKALVVVLVLGVTAFATQAGILAPAAGLLRSAASFAFDQPTQSLGAALAAAGVGPAPALDLALGLVLGAGLLLYVFKDPSFRRSRLDLQLGLGLGTLIALGFVLTGWLQASPIVASPASVGPPWAVASLTFVAPIAEAQLWAMTGDGAWPGFGAALVIGTVLGAALSAVSAGRARIETFGHQGDMIRHVSGGGLMGFGGILALGCTVGQGMTGLATLALGSFLALFGIVIGAVLALRRLERGSWRAALGLGGPAGLGPAGGS